MAKLRVLVVAELNTIGNLISILLDSEGFDVTVVDAFNRVEEIYAELSRETYDVIMPTDNGLSPNKMLDLLTEVKKKHPNIKIMVLSALEAPEFLRDLEEQGTDVSEV